MKNLVKKAKAYSANIRTWGEEKVWVDIVSTL